MHYTEQALNFIADRSLLNVIEHGIDEKRLETLGAGPDEPIDSNKTAAGRARNRRIEFMVLID